ncbi:MAG: hypothetical protein HQM10_09950 [Candidatus Riflebacteria bacterium]|nr:hypothetical protein [Candidatus Riflebacteria bacterium]
MNFLRKKSLNSRFFVFFLIFSFLGLLPGINEQISLYAQSSNASVSQEISPFSEVATVTPGKMVSTYVASGSSETLFPATWSASVASSVTPLSPEVQKQMSKIEQIAWNFAKGLLPTLAVMAFSAAVALPLAWVVVGAVLVGAASSAVLTTLYENRMNQFRSGKDKKGADKILRDVTIAAAVDGAMAPFTMLTAGFISVVGPATAKSIVTTAAKVAAAQFYGQTLSNITKAGVTNAWYYKYYDSGKEEKALKERLSELKNKGNLTNDEQLEFASSTQNLEKLLRDKYTWNNFLTDQRNSAINSLINGFVGGAAAGVVSQGSWAKIASQKLFKTPSKAGLVANAIISNPFAYTSGAVNALILKEEINFKIDEKKTALSGYASGTPMHTYIQKNIDDLQTAHDSIKPIASGATSMLDNMAVQSAILSSTVISSRLMELPSQKRDAVQGKFAEQSSEWKKAEALKQDYEALKNNPPEIKNYTAQENYQKALKEYNASLEEARAKYELAKAEASVSQNTPENKEKLNKISQDVEQDIALKQRQELAKALGGEDYVEFKMEEIKKREGSPADISKLRQMALEEIQTEWSDTAMSNAKDLADMEDKIALKVDSKSHTTVVEINEDGKKVYVVRNAVGKEVFRKEAGTTGKNFWNIVFNTDPDEAMWRELSKIKTASFDSGAMIKPSQYRAKYVDMKVAEMRGQGVQPSVINSSLDAIIAEADSSMMRVYGGSMLNVVRSEILAAGLERAKYSNGEPPDLKTMVSSSKTLVENALLSQFQTELKAQAKKVSDGLVQEDNNNKSHHSQPYSSVPTSRTTTHSYIPPANTSPVYDNSFESDISNQYNNRISRPRYY